MVVPTGTTGLEAALATATLSESSSSSSPSLASSASAAPATRKRKPRKTRVILSGTAEEILARNTSSAPPAVVDKLVKQAALNWHKFYRSHAAVQFFKDRHWTEREWDIGTLLGCGPSGGEREGDVGDEGETPGVKGPPVLSELQRQTKGKGKAVLEVGCGTGAFVYPLLERYPAARFVAFDFAKKAVELTKEHPLYDPSHLHAFQHDLTLPVADLHDQLEACPPDFGAPAHSFDIVSSIFVLSALAPRQQATAVKTLVSLLAPGGSLLFRDYALHDAAQLRFHSLPSASYASIPSLLSPQTRPTSPSSPTAATLPSPAAPSSASPSTDGEDSNLHWYKRGDNTLTYFFTTSEIDSLIARAVDALNEGKVAGDDEFVELEGGVEIVERETVNRAEGVSFSRRFVHGSWRRVR
ncbi:hypothetical protein JCM10213_000893 [Rhodosporidiobolus nylandii]